MTSTITTRLQLADEDLNFGDIYYTVFPIPAGEVADVLNRPRNPNRVIGDVNGRGELQQNSRFNPR